MELLSLTATYPNKRRLSLQMSVQRIAAVVLHVLILAALAYQVPGVARELRRPMAAMVITPYAPGHVAMVTPPKPKIIHPKEEPKLAMKEPDTPPPSAGDPSGENDVTVALANFYPDPKPDLTALPHGTRGDIVVDIVIDEDGKVVDAQVDQGLGHGVDEAVLAIIQTWKFYPATRADKPVPSKQQLLFHFERA